MCGVKIVMSGRWSQCSLARTRGCSLQRMSRRQTGTDLQSQKSHHIHNAHRSMLGTERSMGGALGGLSIAFFECFLLYFPGHEMVAASECRLV